MIDGETAIVFMRERKKPSESLITLEIIGERIAQAKGFRNRGPSEEEGKFLEKYSAHLKELRDKETE